MNKLNNYIELARDRVIEVIKDRKNIVKIAVIVLILMISLIVRISSNHENTISIDTSQVEDSEEVSELCVDISGEINNPGVYTAQNGTRLYEIIEKAGGLTDNADTNNINQAKYVEDGEKIIIPSLNNSQINTGNIASNNPVSGLININTASREELMELPGVGEAIADRIIEYRSTTQFKSIEDIMCVNGIGNATFEKMKSKITV